LIVKTVFRAFVFFLTFL